jgi:hypothetical protein
MYPTLDFFPYDLGDPILIPADDDSETANKTIDSSIFGNPSLPSQVEEAEEWADIT